MSFPFLHFISSLQSDDSGNDSDSSESSQKRKRYDDATIERRIERRKWEENRFVLFIPIYLRLTAKHILTI